MSSKVLVPLTGTVVVRDGNRIRPTIGKAFDYTAEEVASLKSAGAKFREATNETPDAGVVATSTKEAAAPVKASPAPKGGKKAVAADKDDDL